MERADFIRNYMMRSGLALTMMRPWGYELPSGRKRYALTCDCKDKSCQGWAMVSGDMLTEHAELYGPETEADDTSGNQ